MFYCLWLLFCFVLEGEKYTKKMIRFSTSFKLNEIHTVDSPFYKDPKNIIFFQGGPNFGGGTAGKFREIGNNRDIYCYANWGGEFRKSILAPTPGYQNPCDTSIFLHARST